MAMSGQVTKHSAWPVAMAGRPVSAMPLEPTFRCQHVLVKKLPQLRFLQKKSKLLQLVASSTSDPNINIDSFFPSYTIKQFYSAINEKNLDQLRKLLSDDCSYEDYSFPTPFQGKKETMHYLEQLIAVLGQNTEFHVEHIWEGDGYTAGVNWHLAWKKKQVPFTRGNTYFELSTRDERLVIKKARVIIESPIKPGGLALALFAILNSLFDTFPEAAERFLRSPEVLFQLLLKAYNTLFKPIMEPLLGWYIKLWSFTAYLLSFIFKMLQYIKKILYK